ncbi:MAG: hypothetical protein JO112_06000 [Planctomycetes bacterium]|nr:hypothetical protein [Planctomycetota bacterium]
MRFARPAAALFLSLAVLGSALAPVTANTKEAKSEHKTAKEKIKKATSKTAKKPAAKAKTTPTTFMGEVVLVNADAGGHTGTITVKHANSIGHTFHVTAATKITGAPELALIHKGAMVTVVGTTKDPTSINVTGNPADGINSDFTRGTITGIVVAVLADSYGDKGQLSVKTAAGVKTFHITNATHVKYDIGGKVIIHTLQGIHVGQTVQVLAVGEDIAAVTVTKQ